MKKVGRGGFTLMELLVVISIVLGLAGMTLGAARFMQEKGRRDRARIEVQKMETALESYKTDNGGYPTSSASVTTPNFPNPHNVPSSFEGYISAATILYQSLSGKTTSNPDDPATNRVYLEFSLSQLDPKTKAFVTDPWHNPYGYNYTQSAYSTGDFYDSNQQIGYNTNFADLWSTGGLDEKTGKPNSPNRWITNWQN